MNFIFMLLRPSCGDHLCPATSGVPSLLADANTGSAAGFGRIDATACLVRRTIICRIIFGGPSTLALHQQTIQVEDETLVQGKRVLLLDDIAKSGVSLVACRKMLQEAGAEMVQAVALGRVIVDIRG
ncbi:MAG: phosphoribosyltransferase family protein [Janthinobacterium lividum]